MRVFITGASSGIGEALAADRQRRYPPQLPVHRLFARCSVQSSCVAQPLVAR